MRIDRSVDIPSALEYDGNVRVEILDAVTEKGPFEYGYEIIPTYYTPGNSGRISGPPEDCYPPEPAEFDVIPDISEVVDAIVVMLIDAHKDIITADDIPAIRASVVKFEEYWQDEFLDEELAEAYQDEKDYWAEMRGAL